MITKQITDLFTLHGTFGRVSGEVTRTGKGYCYRNKELETVTVLEEHPSGVISRRDTVTNRTEKPIRLRTALSKFTYDSGEYEVYTQYSEWISESMGAWQPLISGVFGMSDEARSNVSVNPFVAIYNRQNKRGVAFHIMAESLFEYRVRRCSTPNLTDKSVVVELGIGGDDMDVTLPAGESLVLPEILFYEFVNKTDMDAYKLHRYCNDVYPAKDLPVLYNSWMSHFDLMNDESFSEQLRLAKEVGCEYFTVDAGWFGKPTAWWDSVGDWQESRDAGFCGGLKDFADKVRRNGLKFGLWFEIERAAKDSESVKRHPEYYISQDDYRFLDFGNSEARDYVYGMLKANIDRYGIEFIKFDFNACLRDDGRGDSLLTYFAGHRTFLERLRWEYPNLHLENCASGGSRLALANVRNFDSFWMSDNHSLYKQLEIYKNTVIRMPSRILERWVTIRSVPDFTPTYPVGGTCEKILVSGDAGWGHIEAVKPHYLANAVAGGLIGVSCDLTQVSESTRMLLAETISAYKAEREFWKNSECRILADTDTVLVLQFNDPEFRTVKLYVYTTHSYQHRVTVYPVCEEDGVYTVNGESVRGKDLLSRGVSMDADGIRTASALELKKYKTEESI